MSQDPSVYPYNDVLRITGDLGGYTYQGSGVLISPDEVLTASHVLYHQGQGVVTNVMVSQGFSTGLSVAYSSFHYFPVQDANDTLTFDQSQFDYAIIHLSHPLTGVGYMGLYANFIAGNVQVTGYPTFAGGTQVNSYQYIQKDSQYSLLDGQTLGVGSSGGPVWVNGSYGPQVVGVVSSADTAGNGYFTQITSAIFSQIQTWVTQDDGTTPTPVPVPTPTPLPVITPTPVPTPSLPTTLIHSIGISQQIELIYVGYFNRAGDKNGFNFWLDQNTQAQNRGQSADDALKNIANSFTPQPETQKLYPFLNSAKALGTDTQYSISGFLDSVYTNLFNHVADTGGKAYWTNQILSGQVGLGASILTIANGALGADDTTVRSKINTAYGLTTTDTIVSVTPSASKVEFLRGIMSSEIDSQKPSTTISATIQDMMPSSLPMKPEASSPMTAYGDIFHAVAPISMIHSI